MRDLFRRIMLLGLLFSSPLLWAQTTANVTGVVTDTTGAIVSDATVVLSNPTTGVSYTAKTNSAGSYRFTEVPPGPDYVMTFTHTGFAEYKVEHVYVNVANVRTQDAKLAVGSSEVVEVTARGQDVTINTEDASIGNNFEVDQLIDLPIQARLSPTALFTDQPGITSTGATTGARTDQTAATVDGLDVSDFSTGTFGSITVNAPVDSVQEFRGTTAGFTVDSGPGGGGQFQLVTKSGTNKFHGQANEYHRDNSTTANSWANNDTVPSPIRAAKLVRNQFGGAIGGPILHDKLFFFFDYTADRIAQQASVTRTVPVPAFASGTVTYINNSGSNCKTGVRLDQTINANCISTLTAAQVQALDPAGKGESPAMLALLKLYPAPNVPSGGDSVNTQGFRFNADAGSNTSAYTQRVDYNLTRKIKLSGIGRFSRENQIQPNAYAQFPGLSPAGQFVDRSYSYIGTMDWQIGTNKSNRFGYGEVVQDWSFPRALNPLGVNQVSFASGTITLMANPYSSPVNAQARHVPIPQVSDDFTWQVGRHSITFGGVFKWINPSTSTKLDYNLDVVGLGGNVQQLTSQAGQPSMRPSNIGSTPTYDSAFAAILGRVGAVSTTFNYSASGSPLPLGTGSNRNYRYYQTMAYIGDSWKATPDLTLTYGLNYQLFSVPYEKNGLESVQTMSFNNYMNARVAQSNAGNTAINGVPLITYYLGGPANHGPNFYNPDYHDLAPRFAFAYTPPVGNKKTVINGGVGMVYDRTVVSAVLYQEDQYSYLFSQPSQVNYGSATNAYASLQGDARYDTPPVIAAPATPHQPFTPGVSSTGALTGLENSLFNETVDPTLKTPYSIMANFGVQHEFPMGFILKASYVGRFGRDLLAQADTSQLVDFPDKVSGQTMGQAMAALETQVRTVYNSQGEAAAGNATYTAQPYFEHLYAALGPNGTANTTTFIAQQLVDYIYRGDFADTVEGLSPYTGNNVGMASQLSENTMYTNKGNSTYHGLLVTLQKNLSHGLKFDLNYTWSHSIDNVSVIANAPALAGYGFICDALNSNACRGNSDFDVTNILNGDFTYQLPFGRGRSFGGGMPLWLDEVVGGWDISGIPNYQSGQAFSTVSNAFVAGYSNNAPGILVGPKSALVRNVHKPAGSTAEILYNNSTAAANAFTGPLGFQMGSRGNLRGPRAFNFDAGLAKTFQIWPERVKMQLRMDAFNALNHPVFAAPANNSAYDDISQSTGGPFGQLVAPTTNFRVVQISARIQF